MGFSASNFFFNSFVEYWVVFPQNFSALVIFMFYKIWNTWFQCSSDKILPSNSTIIVLYWTTFFLYLPHQSQIWIFLRKTCGTFPLCLKLKIYYTQQQKYFLFMILLYCIYYINCIDFKVILKKFQHSLVSFVDVKKRMEFIFNAYLVYTIY